MSPKCEHTCSNAIDQFCVCHLIFHASVNNASDQILHKELVLFSEKVSERIVLQILLAYSELNI